MSRFKEEQFYQIIDNIEKAEFRDEDIWIAVGILEMMYDDDCGWLDKYFCLAPQERCKKDLWKKLQDHILKLNFEKIS